MKTMLDKATRDEIIQRIHSLNESCVAQWGKMNVYQMLKHCSLWEEMVLGRQQYKQSFIGKIFGRSALKSVLKDDSPLRRNTPTAPGLAVTETSGNVANQKATWISLLKEYEQFPEYQFIHPFFGKMSKEQIGRMAFKHADHHLRQFGC